MPDDPGPRSDGSGEADAVRPDAILTGDAASTSGHGAIRDAKSAAWRDLLWFLPDMARLLRRLARDPRVPWHAKAVAGVAVAYVLSPIDVIPDVFGRVGQMDDIYIVTKALRYLFATAGYDVVREHWSGTNDGFTLLLVIAGIDR
jgi:uncharacterized membrane protein YkvA (DUF1232 family)